ncbi:MAG TPA: hypothetical protein VNR40_06520 [Steroidobacter sp.]|nr:hypothetical protein [Steroidobacter sp.]
MKPRCAIVECYNRHDEVYLTTASLMQRLGYEVHVFNTMRNRVKNSFVHAPALARHVHSRWSSAGVLRAASAGRFDVVIFNTLEGSAVLECAQQIIQNTPVLGFIHNASFLANKPEYSSVINDDRCRLLALAPYIACYVAGIADLNYMYPVFFYERSVPRIASNGKRRFCVQGYFDPKRRQYSQLVAALEQLRSEGRNDFEVYVMGRWFSKEFKAFNAEVERKGLAHYVRYTWKGIGYRSYFRLLNSVDFIMPLVSPQSHPEYFRGKSTSSVAAAIGFGKVPVLHERLAELYGIERFSLTYTDDLAGAMRSALDLPANELATLQTHMLQIKADYSEFSLHQMEQSIAQLDAASTRIVAAAAL